MLSSHEIDIQPVVVMVTDGDSWRVKIGLLQFDKQKINDPVAKVDEIYS